jgi:hypothetical protein
MGLQPRTRVGLDAEIHRSRVLLGRAEWQWASVSLTVSGLPDSACRRESAQSLAWYAGRGEALIKAWRSDPVPPQMPRTGPSQAVERIPVT